MYQQHHSSVITIPLSISNIILALNLLNLLDTLIKVANMSFITYSNDLSKKSLLIIGILYFW